MIKQGLKNYLSNLKYFFTPLGTLFLGIVIGISILIPGTINIIKNLGLEAGEILNNTSLNFDAFQDILVTSIESLNWNNLDEALSYIFNYEWVYNTLNRALQALVGDFGSSAEEISVLIESTITSFVPLLVQLVLFSLLGLVGGFFLTKWLVRKEIASRSIKKYIFVSIVDSILTALLVSFILWLVTVWQPSVIFTSFLAILLFGLVALFEAYLVHSNNKVDIKKIVNVKNVGKLFVSNLIIFVISISFTLLFGYLINDIVAFFVGISFIEISFIVISLNAESYVKNVATKQIKA